MRFVIGTASASLPVGSRRARRLGGLVEHAFGTRGRKSREPLEVHERQVPGPVDDARGNAEALLQMKDDGLKSSFK